MTQHDVIKTRTIETVLLCSQKLADENDMIGI